jgi:tetratricopeptide (TPR) repeat protein
MTDTLNTNEPPASPTLPADEQRILDTALLDSDQLLARTLYGDQLRRRRRIAWLLILLCGGVAMTMFLWAIMTGMFAVTTAQVDIEQANKLSQEGWQLWQQGNPIAAVEKFTQSTELNPKNADTWNGLGWSQFSSGDSIAAEKSFQRCVKLSPKHPAGLNGLGQIYLMWKEYPKAEKYLKQAAPQATAAWYGLARLYLLQGDFKKAKPWAERFAAEDPANKQGQQMLKAAENEKLEEDLRILLEPPGKPDSGESAESQAETTPQAETTQDRHEGT